MAPGLGRWPFESTFHTFRRAILHPFDQITRRDNDAFPFDAFSNYPHLLAVDWREEEGYIAQMFLKATGLASDSAQLHFDKAAGHYKLICRETSIPVSSGNEVSAQNAMLMALQQAFGDSHSIRYLNHVTAGDTAYFVVETLETWQRLERENPYVRWFFTPIERLPDIFTSEWNALHEAGRQYANGT